MHRVNAYRQLRSITVFLVVLASIIPLGAQTTAQFPKATGVGNAVVQRAMTGLHPLATFRVGGNPDWMALTADSVWVTISSTNSVIRLNAATNQVGESVTVAKPCSGLAIGFGSLWVPSCADHNLVRVDLETRKVVARIPAGPANAEGGITTGAGSVWMVTSPRGVLARIDPTNDSVVARIKNSTKLLCGRLCGWLGVDYIHGKESTCSSRSGNEQTRVGHKRGEEPALPDRGGWFGVDTQPGRRHHLPRRYEDWQAVSSD